MSLIVRKSFDQVGNLYKFRKSSAVFSQTIPLFVSAFRQPRGDNPSALVACPVPSSNKATLNFDVSK